MAAESSVIRTSPFLTEEPSLTSVWIVVCPSTADWISIALIAWSSPSLTIFTSMSPRPTRWNCAAPGSSGTRDRPPSAHTPTSVTSSATGTSIQTIQRLRVRAGDVVGSATRLILFQLRDHHDAGSDRGTDAGRRPRAVADFRHRYP